MEDRKVARWIIGIDERRNSPSRVCPACHQEVQGETVDRKYFTGNPDTPSSRFSSRAQMFNSKMLAEQAATGIKGALIIQVLIPEPEPSFQL